MPTYCSIITDVNSIPAESDMVLFKPYFEIGSGVTQFEVKIKVPSDCYYLDSDTNSPPSGGACGDPGDLQHSIYLDKLSPCSNASDKVLSLTLHYNEDPTGEKLIVYVVDNSDAGKTKGGSKTIRNVHP